MGCFVTVYRDVAAIRPVTQVLDQVVLPRTSRANNPNWNEPTSELLREQFVERKLKPWFGRNCWRDDVARFVDG
jgi:hypothetical protein